MVVELSSQQEASMSEVNTVLPRPAEGDGPKRVPVPATEMLHESPRGVIYLSKGNNINWLPAEGIELGVGFVRATTEIRYLSTQLKLTIKDDKVVNRALKMMASGLELALEAGSRYPDDYDYLGEARKFVETRQRETLEFRYFVSAAVTLLLLSAGLLAATTLPLVSEAPPFLVAAALGGGGAMLSVSQRLRSMPLERYSSTYHTSVAGSIRIVLGCAFGAIFLLLQRAGLLMKIADANAYLLHAAAFVAGFSERLIPELLEQLEKQTIRSSERDVKPGAGENRVLSPH